MPNYGTLVLGSTGTRHGMSPAQKAILTQLLARQPPDTAFHHGGCKGADAQAHELAIATGLAVHVHWGDDPKWQATLYGLATHSYPPEPNLQRNRLVVHSCNMLIACPLHDGTLSGGTAYTIRYAQRQDKRVSVILPNGKVLHYSGLQQQSTQEILTP